MDQSTKDETMGMPIIQESNQEQSENEKPSLLPKHSPPPSPINNLMALESNREEAPSPDPESSVRHEHEHDELRKLEINSIQTLALKEEEEPRHSSYGPRVKRYLSNSQSREKPADMGSTVSRFSGFSTGLSPSYNATMRSLEIKDRARVLPPLNLSKFVLQYQSPESPLSTALISLSEKVQRVLEPLFSSYPFQMSLFSTLASLKSSVTKHMSTVLAPPPSQPPPEVCSDWEPDRMMEFFMKYQPRYRAVKPAALTSQEGLALKRYRNCVYFGGMKDGKKHGCGVVVYFGKGGMVFEGRFQAELKIEGA